MFSEDVLNTFINFDFGTEWQNILPIICSNYMKNVIFYACNQWFKDKCKESNIKPYSLDIAPASYLSAHGNYEKIIHLLKKQLQQYEQLIVLHNVKREEIAEKIKRLKHLLRPFSFDDNPEIYHFIGFGSCHYTCKYICYELAKILFPDDEYHVYTSDKHTSVISLKTSRVFDIILWAVDGRLENYLGIDDIQLYHDNTLGGSYAIEEVLDLD